MCVFNGVDWVEFKLRTKPQTLSSHPAVSAQSHSKDKKGRPHSFHDHRTLVCCNETNRLITMSHCVPLCAKWKNV